MCIKLLGTMATLNVELKYFPLKRLQGWWLKPDLRDQPAWVQIP